MAKKPKSKTPRYTYKSPKNKNSNFKGIWLLRKMTETVYSSGNCFCTINTILNPAVVVLIEPEYIQLTWHAGTANCRTVGFQVSREMISTRPLLSNDYIRAKYELQGQLMFWEFIINKDSKNYSHFKYEFIREY